MEQLFRYRLSLKRLAHCSKETHVHPTHRKSASMYPQPSFEAVNTTAPLMSAQQVEPCRRKHEKNDSLCMIILVGVASVSMGSRRWPEIWTKLGTRNPKESLILQRLLCGNRPSPFEVLSQGHMRDVELAGYLRNYPASCRKNFFKMCLHEENIFK